MVRFSGAVGDEHTVVLGVLLIVLAVGMMAEVLRSLGAGVWKEIEKNKQPAAADAEAEPEAAEAHVESGVEAGEPTTAGGGTSPDDGIVVSSSRAPASPSGSSWGGLSKLMCAEGGAAGGDAKMLEDAEAKIAKPQEVIARQSEGLSQLRK